MNFISNRAIWLFLAGSLFYFPTLSVAGNETKFSSVEAMIEEFNDYSASNGTLKILAKEPLHIQLSPIVVKRDFPEVIEEAVKRALVYGVYRTFTHTPANNIVVTVVPKEMNFKNKEYKYVSEYKRTISITRKAALALVKKHIHVRSFSDLVSETKIGDITMKDQWTKNFKRIYYNDKGYPGLDSFVTNMAKQGF